jgi:hypothetical protein
MSLIDFITLCKSWDQPIIDAVFLANSRLKYVQVLIVPVCLAGTITALGGAGSVG